MTRLSFAPLPIPREACPTTEPTPCCRALLRAGFGRRRGRALAGRPLFRRLGRELLSGRRLLRGDWLARCGGCAPGRRRLLGLPRRRCLCFCGCFRLCWRLGFCPGGCFFPLQAASFDLVANAGERCGSDGCLLVVRNAVERFEERLRHVLRPARSTRPGIVLDGHGRLVPFGPGARAVLATPIFGYANDAAVTAASSVPGGSARRTWHRGSGTRTESPLASVGLTWVGWVKGRGMRGGTGPVDRRQDGGTPASGSTLRGGLCTIWSEKAH